jgi:hypothetical protein
VVHEAKGAIREQAVVKMIFDDDDIRDPKRFFQQFALVIGVVQHIDEHRNIPALIGIRKMQPVEQFDRDSGFRPDEHVNAINRDIWPVLHQQSIEAPVARSDIQHSCAMWNRRDQCIAQAANSPSKYIAMVDAGDQAHTEAFT